MDTDGTKSYAKRYDEPFKKDTVEHWVKNRKSVKEVSEAMGVSEITLYKWRKNYEFNIKQTIICHTRWYNPFQTIKKDRID